jgi:hypothetical protein
VLVLWIINILIALDQLANALAFGDPGETISSRVGKAIRRAKTPRKWTIAYWLNKLLDLFEQDHCIKHIQDDEGKDGLI